jgi:2-keto-4-pentenoate hydratase
MGIADAVIENLAKRLRDAAEQQRPIPPIRDELGAGGVAAAYRVQETNTRYRLAQGRRLAGRKIGLTSRAVQRQLGVDSPDFGMLFADMALRDGQEVAFASVLQPRAEAEVAFVLGRDLGHRGITFADVVAAVAYMVPAIEIVGSRIEDWNIELLDTVADNASSGMYVLGDVPHKLDGLDLRRCGMVMDRRGEQVSVGTGAACMGHPLHAVVWLARTMVDVGRPLAAGDVVMSGALGPMVPVAPGDVIEARIDGLGTVRVAFAA